MADIFQNLDTADPETLTAIVERLEYRGTYPPFVAMMQRYFDRLPLDKMGDVLDMGCGTGVVTRALARRCPETTKITGSDFSAALIEVANDLAAQEGVGGRIKFEVADSQKTGNTRSSYDLVVMHTLLSHVVDPALVLAEAARLAKPGGWIAVFDGDYASITFGAGDPQINDRALAGLLKTLVANPRVMRQFPEIVKREGLTIEDYLPEILAEAGKAEFFDSMLRSYGRVMVDAGHLDENTADNWQSTHLEASDRGTFFGSINFATYLLRKPD